MSHDLPALIQRLEAAEGPDRELDSAVCVALHECKMLQYLGDNPAFDNCTFCLEYTTSLDASLALMREVLPGDTHGVVLSNFIEPYARIEPRTGADRESHSGFGQTFAIALLIAILKAKQAESEAQDG